MLEQSNYRRKSRCDQVAFILILNDANAAWNQSLKRVIYRIVI